MVSSIGSSWIWATGLITFVLGIACGAGFTYLMTGNNRRRTTELQARLDQLQQEFDGYRDQVGRHFRKTSELVQSMTDSYRNVYEHLAKGSEALCQDPVSTPRLDFPQHAEQDAEADTPAPDTDITDTFSDAETDSVDDMAAEDILGDAPRVPNLDKLYTEEHPTHRTPSA
ncbi:MAG: hypothetical protein BMS9Abin06_0235 [Gammaproteobacteria bacterium]|nr:MAG: hypothetical protein BMS9Abin06_0235 [Gammaproteobacteria bacterium]